MCILNKVEINLHAGLRAISVYFTHSQYITHLSPFQDSGTHLNFVCHCPNLIYIVAIFYDSELQRGLKIDVRAIDTILIVRVLHLRRIRKYICFYSQRSK